MDCAILNIEVINMLQVGNQAFPFSLLDKDGKTISLDDFKGRKVIVYFYPKDNTPGCTKQACAFKNAYDIFKRNDIVVIGISKDTQKSHQKFTDKFELPFILLSDPDLSAIHGFDVWKEKKLYGKSYMGVVRATFIIDESGKILKVFEKANPASNAQDIIEYLKII